MFMKKVNKVSMVYIFDSLNSLGFEMKFKATVHGLLSLTTPKTFQPYQIQIVHFYRFEGESDPSDSSIV
jgi:hypothetical protein